MQLLAGTSGYAYKEWKGAFYPSDLPQARMLSYYADHLPAVEINNTFYRLPKSSVLERWADQVPEAFRFSIKASRRITHFKRLKNAAEETQFLLGETEALGDRLGALLFQLPPTFELDRGRLEAFLELLPEGTPAAFEFRHPSWSCEEVHALLRARGFALVMVDEDEAEEHPIVSTAEWGYMRLRRSGYPREELARWAQRASSQGWRHSFVFFKHEDAGAGPKLAELYLEVGARLAGRKPAAARPAAVSERKTA